MKIKPMKGRTVIAPYTVLDRMTPGGLIIPATARKDPQLAEVLAVGAGAVAFSVGDIVLYEPYTGIGLKHEDEKYLVVESASILATVDPGTELSNFS